MKIRIFWGQQRVPEIKGGDKCRIMNIRGNAAQRILRLRLVTETLWRRESSSLSKFIDIVTSREQTLIFWRGHPPPCHSLNIHINIYHNVDTQIHYSYIYIYNIFSIYGLDGYGIICVTELFHSIYRGKMAYLAFYTSIIHPTI